MFIINVVLFLIYIEFFYVLLSSGRVEIKGYQIMIDKVKCYGLVVLKNRLYDQ